MTRIAIAVIATGPYAAFVEPLLASARAMLFSDCEREFLLFTDAEPAEPPDDCHLFRAEHQRWPLVTLRRFATLLRAEQRIAAADWFLFLDADMLVASPIAFEEMFDDQRPLTGVRHPYVAPRGDYPLERDPRSSAFVAKGKEAAHYWQGCLWGGRSAEALAMLRELAACVADEQKGVVARWHDESHLNRYLGEREAQVKTLDPGFALPDRDGSLPFPPRILHLDKDDHAFGNFGAEQARAGMLERARRWLRRR